ncbi:NAD(P)/FAD-dependent oxidoreductase [Paenibacillus lutrae]|nr:NAD(P)/FAD-dependent oxidoreductase [Paenibacillus lutrae]
MDPSFHTLEVCIRQENAMYDVIIVGARCAGAALAAFLGSRGHRILLVDQFPFPSGTNSTHILGESGVYERLGILQKMESAGAPALTRMRIDLLGTVFESDITVTQRALGLRREILDPLLLQSAARSGRVDIQLNTRVTKVLIRSGQAAGIQCSRKDGTNVRFYGRIIVGADGRNSMVARQVQAPVTAESQQPLHGVTYAYFSRVEPLPIPAVEWYWHGSSIVINSPIDGLMHCIAYMYPPAERQAMAGISPDSFLEKLRAIRTLQPRLGRSEVEGAIRGIPPLKSIIRKAWGPGWALAGDAGAFLHPAAGVGIDNAVCTAEYLAEELHAFLQGRKTWEYAMETYEKQRNKRIFPQYDHSLATLDFSLQPVPEASLDTLAMLATFPSLVKKVGLQAGEILSIISGGKNHE